MTAHELGLFGVWRGYKGFRPEEAAELEQLGYSALWLGGSPPAALPTVEPLLAATTTLTVGTSIVNIWTAPAAEVAESFHRIDARYPGRFLLGIGVGHPEAVSAYRKPYDALAEYLDDLDAAGVPRERRAVAALGPRVLELARDRSAGALPYLTTPEHTRRARDVLGAASLLAVEQKLVVDDDAERARAVGRPVVARYLGLRNYVANLRRLGYEESDVAGQGSDRLVDALAVHGTAAQVADRLRAHRDAGADHVALQPLEEDYLAPLRALAPLLR
ncbi:MULTISPECIES: LLM class F420-dependent oxidoreductase [Nocardia]|uniref:LLM class F420-dependent oxidoreductase n=1 Tax=Nocardia TaxID=1817 RepID=UPI000BF0AE00|nr:MULTISPECIES: LLM class F420-dependent oxidoreductase [Nocardia]MBF6187504.1 LLM class F420-dependent oxidoreductase [Nocardia farcinica]MBF6247050.1 LLM class F420-dependent oxidoreductase [Nocardia elegans]MBF6314465.1 LLM class F420-dependent oxidoreductase [Nocardia farcinica]MBF6410339.1 LLM class F420-dependent oxidoreductase [Nocardia farcinica]PEH79047.1 LLM class F420-dependent oxidoreductase [Nocardia sp. FDAARGOS_372]